MIDLFHGTLVGDEQDAKGDSDLTATWNKILNQGFQRGRPLIICDGSDNQPRKFEIYGPKVLASRKRFADDATESRCLSIPIEQRTRDDIPRNLPRGQFDREALSLRNKLQLWRFRNWQHTELNEGLAIPGVEDRLNQIAVPLLSVIGDESVRRSIANMLNALQIGIQSEKSESWAGQIVEYLCDRWSNGVVNITVGDVTAHLNERMAADQGVPMIEFLAKPLTPHQVGKVIRDELGLRTSRRGGCYRVQHDAKRLAELHRRYVVVEPPSESPGSPNSAKSCTETAAEDGVTAGQDLQDLPKDSPRDLETTTAA